jgi:hypothetical protein
MTMMRWGIPPPPRAGGPPVTNIRNMSSPHWPGWLKPENRCLVPPTASQNTRLSQPGDQEKRCRVVRRATNQAAGLRRLAIFATVLNSHRCAALGNIRSFMRSAPAVPIAHGPTHPFQMSANRHERTVLAGRRDRSGRSALHLRNRGLSGLYQASLHPQRDWQAARPRERLRLPELAASPGDGNKKPNRAVSGGAIRTGLVILGWGPALPTRPPPSDARMTATRSPALRLACSPGLHLTKARQVRNGIKGTVIDRLQAVHLGWPSCSIAPRLLDARITGQEKPRQEGPSGARRRWGVLPEPSVWRPSIPIRRYGCQQRDLRRKGCQSASKFGSDAILVQLRLFCAK